MNNYPVGRSLYSPRRYRHDGIRSRCGAGCRRAIMGCNALKDYVAIMLTGIFLSGWLPASAQDKDVVNAFRKLSTSKGADRMDVLKTIGEYYLDKPGAERNDMDSAMILLSAFKSLADSLHDMEGRLEVLKELGKWYFEEKDNVQGANYFRQVIELARSKGTPLQRANCLLDIGTWCVPFKESLFPEKDRCLQQAIILFGQLSQKKLLAWTWIEAGFMQYNEGKLDESDSSFFQALQISRSFDPGMLPYIYKQLADNSKSRGHLEKALFYALESVRDIGQRKKGWAQQDYYMTVADIYQELGKTAESVIWYRRAYDADESINHHVRYLIINHFCTALITLGKPKEALDLVTGTIKRQGIEDAEAHMNVSIILGNCYNAMRDYSTAETHYLEAIKWNQQLNREYIGMTDGLMAIAGFYTQRQESKKAMPYLTEVLKFQDRISIDEKIAIEDMLSKADSSTGDYLSALQHARRYKTLSDSVFNDKKGKQIEELKIQYETAKKEKDFQLLKSRSDLQQRALMGTAQERKFIYAGIGMLLVILGLGYNRYRLKQRSNRQLQEQQGIISQKNIHLEDLVQEKEWLLREIHHRVKNNLQIVISLLNTQSAFIDNEAALAAIRESRHRMQAMSMIHQKLYQEGDITLINMQAYIREFVSYLDESFNASSRIRFDLSVCQVELDVSQAIPIALILNEVITNALKHAFPGNAAGTIRVLLRRIGENELRTGGEQWRKDGDEPLKDGSELAEDDKELPEDDKELPEDDKELPEDGKELPEDDKELPEDGQELLLSISDNGRGWSKERKHDAGASFGMNLIDTLARQLEGELSFINDGGVSVTLRFRQQLTSDKHHAL